MTGKHTTRMMTAVSFAESPLGNVAAVGNPINAPANVGEAGVILTPNTRGCETNNDRYSQNFRLRTYADAVAHGGGQNIMWTMF